MNSENGAPQPELSASKKGLLEKRLRGVFKGTARARLIPARTEVEAPAPLSFVQQSLWVIHQMEPDSLAYNVPTALRLNGTLDVAALKNALLEIVRRHEALRTTFPDVDGNPVQKISPALPAPMQLIDLEKQPLDSRAAELQRLLQEETQRPFDLAQGPLLRYALVRLAAEEHVLILVMHHIVSDGWSMAVFCREMESLYTSFSKGLPSALPELPIQYADFACWQRQWLQGQVLEGQLAYWKSKLAGAPSSVVLPTDQIRLTESRATGAQQSILLTDSFYQALQAMSQKQGSTLFMTMMTALVIALWKWTRQSDLVIGTVVAGRSRREIENLIGCFMNFLPLRTTLTGDESALEVLQQVKETVIEAHARQECPFEKIVEAVKPARRGNQNPLYNVGFLLQNFPRGILSGETLQGSFVPVDTETALLHLRFVGEATGSGLALSCEYDVRLFAPRTIDQLLAAFQGALEKLVAAPETKISEFQLPAELQAQAEAARLRLQQQTIGVTATFTAEPLAEPLQFWIEELELPATLQFAPYNQVFQQLLNPDSLLAANSRGLNVVLVRLQDWERTEGKAQPWPAAQEIVERSARELVSAMQAASRRGTTPHLICLCPSGPGLRVEEERTAFYAKVENQIADGLKNLNGVHVVAPAELADLYPVADFYDPRGDQLGHIPYTPLFFAALGTLIARKFHVLKRTPRKVIVLDCDQTLWAGVCGEDGPRGIHLDPPRMALQQFMRAQHDAGMLLCLCSKNNEEDVFQVFRCHVRMPLGREHFTAARINWRPKSENLQALARELNLGLDSFIFVDDNPMECAEVEAHCPEVLVLPLPEDVEQIPQFLKHAWIFDHLKVTAEDQARTRLYQQNRERKQFQTESISFGDFLAGLHLRIEIAEASSEQLARVAQLTQRTNQFNFTTRRRTDAEIEKLRADQQLRILAVSVTDRFGDYGLVGTMIYGITDKSLQVDTFLLSCRVLGKGVEHRMLAELGRTAQENGLAWVDVRFNASAKNQPALDFLESVGAAFRQGNNGGSRFRFPSEFAAHVQFNPEKLASSRAEPSPAVVATNSSPGAESFALGARFPKCRWIARHAQEAQQILEALESRIEPSTELARHYDPPRNETEEQLCQLWQNLLKVQRVGIRDDFFELGGTSLLAVRIFAELEKISGKSLPLVTLFQAPTIEQLAQIIHRKKSSAPPSCLVAIQPKGSRPPLVLVHGAGGGILWGYANLAVHLDPDQPVYGIEPRGSVGMEFTRVEDMAERYTEALLGLQPHGPYLLGGYCFGGYVAYEMARLLRARGEEIALLALIDSAAPNGVYDKIAWWRPHFFPSFLLNSAHWLKDFFKLRPEERQEFIRRKAGVLRKRLLRRFQPPVENPGQIDLAPFIDATLFPENELKLWQVHLQAGNNYTPQLYAGRVTLLRTRGQPFLCSFDPHYGWKDLAAGGVDVRMIPGSHEGIFVEPDVKLLAAELNACLQSAHTKSDSEKKGLEVTPL